MKLGNVPFRLSPWYDLRGWLGVKSQLSIYPSVYPSIYLSIHPFPFVFFIFFPSLPLLLFLLLLFCVVFRTIHFSTNLKTRQYYYSRSKCPIDARAICDPSGRSGPYEGECVCRGTHFGRYLPEVWLRWPSQLFWDADGASCVSLSLWVRGEDGGMSRTHLQHRQHEDGWMNTGTYTYACTYSPSHPPPTLHPHPQTPTQVRTHTCNPEYVTVEYYVDYNASNEKIWRHHKRYITG